MDQKKIAKVLTTVTLMAMGAGVGFMAAKMGMDSAKVAPTSQVIDVDPEYDFTKAIDELERAYEMRELLMYFIKVDPTLKPLRKEARFKAPMKKMNLK